MKKSVFIAAISLMGSITAHAQTTYPVRPLRLVVPYAPGGSTDILARPIVHKLGEHLGQPVVLDHRPGANTIIGATFTANSSPDGYTLLLGTTSTFVVNTVAYTNLSYSVVRDFAPITQVATYPFFIIASNTFPVNTVSELVALAKAKPGELVYSSTGNGSAAHLAGVLFESMAGVRLTHVPYKGNAPSIVDLVAGRAHFTFGGIPPIKSLLQSGKLRLIATATEKRLASHPQLPTVAESYPGFGAGTWYGIVTRAGTPRTIVDSLNREIARVLQGKDVKEQLETQGYELVASTPDAMSKLIAEDTRKIRQIASSIQFD